jgi:hypothetical protein
MKKLLFILPLLIWVSCEDENAGDEPLIAGIYESRFYYDDSQGLYIEEDPTWGYWEKISKMNISSRLSFFANTDSACYTDWDVSDADWEIIGEDSATLTYYYESWDLYDIWTYKLVEDTLYSYNISIDGEVIFPIGKSIRADSHDFSLSPLCNFSDLFGGG